ncbi:hypothetical protein ACFL1X_06360 [Candidatus Hydrogenedentota bacterium]
MKVDPKTKAYLDEVRSVLKRVTDGSLLGLYATGSISFGDFRRERSDIDLLAVVRQALPGAGLTSGQTTLPASK